MKHIKIFETWNDNNIDKSLFVSGRAKHNPKVIKNRIEYKTDNGKYTAKIEQLGNKFICKVYKINSEGSKIRIKKKIKDKLQSAHNYIREALNDKLEKKNKKKTNKKKKSIDFDDKPINFGTKDDFEKEPIGIEPTEYKKPRKTIIRRYR